ncbi:MAG: DUF6768 family protein [Gammaproteobacteria bacterium]
MKKIDDLITESLSDEDQVLMEQYGAETSYFNQAFALFRGRLGWVMWLVGVVQLLLFAGAAFAFWRLFVATELLIALRWGVGTVVLVQMSILLRSFMGMHFEANRVIREIKRVDLRIVRLGN